MNTSSASPASALLDGALPDLASWTAWFRRADIPVLADTADALEAMRANEDEVDANLIGEMVADDPLMSLKILAYAATHRPARRVTDVETVTAAIVVLGISPFFGTFGAQPTVEDRLGPMEGALDGLRSVIRRAHRAARLAFAFAVHRMDLDAAVIHQAALLHDFAEMLLWCHAPTLALRVRAAMQADPALRSSAAQRALLNIDLAELQQALMKAWALPDLLGRISDERQTRHPSVQSVALAIRLARHSADGWENPAIPDDIADIARLLNLSKDAALEFVHKVED
ncbi:HDOD domain-containing protein [Rhizobacter sp. LjRoot28]|uniref:HDOD domain-containing protein n=1 Tax=Rhizobacter sp. LjRoot28 TaxID=3342309 RepID=UPI003ED137B2